MSQPKVFEFAKEIGMETLVLMDKIREWKLPVRSHMAELEPKVLDQIKQNLQAEQEKLDSPGKKKVVKKVVAKAATKMADVSATEEPAKKVAVKKTIQKKPTDPSEDESAKKGATVVVKKATAKTVIRRKADDEVDEKHASPVVEDTVLDHKAVPADIVRKEVAPVVVSPEVVEPVVAKPVVPKVADIPVVVSDQKETKPVAKEEIAPQPVLVVTPAPAPAPVAPSAPARKREVVMTAHGPVSGVKSDPPKRNIIGRMDLSRVTPPPSQGSGGGSQQHGGGMGAARPVSVSRGPQSGMRNIRTGFVPPPPMDIEVDSQDNRKKDLEKNLKKRAGIGVAAPVVKEKEEEVVHFSSTEFRKREMVFQPKKKKGMLNRQALATEITTPKASKRVVRVDQTMKLSDLAQEMGVKAAQLTKTLMQNGVMATMGTALDFDTISLIVPEFGFEAVNVHKSVDDLIQESAFGLESDLEPRSPIVTVMGHVDHGKTSLLDAIRKADVASGEAGGITQHIGAYRVKTEHGHLITFIDTPGHEAFTAMRARGANATDIAIIVVAADDGVMPQTIEAISHAKAAKVPIIVAVNKIDKPGANPDKIKQQLTEYELVPEEWGGSTIFVNVSALKKTGIQELLEQIYLAAEMEELKANPNRSATGIVIESRIEKGRGSVATLLIQNGTLKVGQAVVCGTSYGRVRSLMNDRGERVNEAGPSIPVEIMGLNEPPLAGERFDVCDDEKSAQGIADARKKKVLEAAAPAKISLEEVFAKMQAGAIKELNVVLKTDVAGSVEAIKGMFDKVATSEVKLKVLHAAVGGISENDVLLASTAKGIVVGFNVRPDSGAQAAAKREGVEIKCYSIVYELMDDMKKAMSGMLSPTSVEKVYGRAEVRNTFSVPKMGTIAGCLVQDGKILRSAQVRLLRDGKVVYTGKIGSLKRFKDDAKEVATGFECGIGIENYNDLKVGDVLEAFSQESISREL